MNCERSREMLVDLIGDEITGTAAKELKQHLQDCPNCREELISLTRTRSLLRQAWPDEAVPQELMFEIPKLQTRRFWGLWDRSGLVRFALASLTITACLALCFLFMALLRTQFRYEQNHFSISFGRAGEPSLQTASWPGKDHLPVEWVSRREVQDLISRAVEQAEANQRAQIQGVTREIGVRMEAKRTADLRRIANELRVLEGSQNNVYRAALSNQSYLETLARDFMLKENSPASSVH